MIAKHFRLGDKELRVLQEVKETKCLASESETIRYIISEYEKSKRKEEGTLQAVLRKIEENEDIVLDVLNTLLIEKNMEICQPVSLRESPVIRKSKEYRRERIGHVKQKKDYRIKKKK